MRRLLAALDRHWFAPAALVDLAIARVAIVGTQLMILLYGANWVAAGIGDELREQLWLARGPDTLYHPLPILQALMFPFGGLDARPDPTFIQAAWVLGVVAAVAAIAGLYTRLSLFVLAYASTIFVGNKYSYGEFHHPEGLVVIMVWVLAFGPQLGPAVDAVRRRVVAAVATLSFRPAPPSATVHDAAARWPLRTGQWLLALAYLSAGVSKLLNGGLDWMNGHTLAYYFLQDSTRYDLPVGYWFAGQVWLSQLLSVVSVVFELTFWVAIVVPSVAWIYVLAGAGFHVGIYVTQFAPFFTFITLYAVFSEPLRTSWASLRRRVRPARTAARAATHTLIYDGLCPLCTRTMVILDALDWRGRLAYVDFERGWDAAASAAPRLDYFAAREAIHLVAPSGAVRRGYDAFRELARLLPPLWPVLPLLYLPPVAWAGRRVYAVVAANRERAVCRIDGCAPEFAQAPVSADVETPVAAASSAASNAPHATPRLK